MIEILPALQYAEKQITIDRDSIVECNQYPDGSMDDDDRVLVDELNDLLLRSIRAAIAKATTHNQPITNP